MRSTGAAGTGPGAPALPTPTGRDVVWTVVGGMGGMGVGLVVGLVPALLLGGTRYLAVGLATTALGGGLGLWLALVRRRGWGLRELGFVAGTRSAWHLLWEVPVALVVGLLCAVALGTLLGLAPDPAGTGADLVTTSFTAAPWSLVVAALCVVLLLPAVEEVVFRRVLLGWLRTRVPLAPAVVVVSAVFAAVHVAPVAVVYLFFLGLSTALLALWHRSLWAPFALHAANNALASLVGVLALTS